MHAILFFITGKKSYHHAVPDSSVCDIILPQEFLYHCPVQKRSQNQYIAIITIYIHCIYISMYHCQRPSTPKSFIYLPAQSTGPLKIVFQVHGGKKLKPMFDTPSKVHFSPLESTMDILAKSQDLVYSQHEQKTWGISRLEWL